MGRTLQIYGFPSYVSGEGIKQFLECHTGEDTVLAVKIRPPLDKKVAHRFCATVQFTTIKSAEVISSLINLRLHFGRSYLKVRDAERDIIQKPKASLCNLEATALYFGFQLSDDRFLSLWKGANVGVNFGFGLKKLEFLISDSPVDYKFELSYSSIWQIQMRSPHKQNWKFLLLQVLAAPRIYKKGMRSSEEIRNEVPGLNYFKDGSDDLWVRTTDFTGSSCVGQSSALCLELPPNCKLPGIKENFHYYKEIEGPFFLESGSTFSCASDLVPIMWPPQRLELPFDILFKVNSLIQHGCLPGPALDTTFYGLVNPKSVPRACIDQALEKLYHLKECCYEPVKWLNEQYAKSRKSKQFRKQPTMSLNGGLVHVRRVQVTPSKVYFCGPDVIVSNRVLRKYQKSIDNFIRVSFVDEDGKKMRSTDLSARTLQTEGKTHTEIYQRVLSTLRNGITIGNKKFDFLAYSSSQLKENSAWMFASGDGTTAASIREWMGDFREIRNVAKYSARLGQSFSSSKETLSVRRDEIDIIPDVEIQKDGLKYIFSDGIGKISAKFARKIAVKCGIKSSTPSAFQIRYGGYKGVVAVDPGSVAKLSLRKSMFKYTSHNIELDVLRWTKIQPCFLNRQVITLLSTLGVPDHIFEQKQNEVIHQLDMILTDAQKAQEALEIMSPGENTNVLKEMLLCGYEPSEEPYLSMMLQTFRASKLFELRTRSRIHVPNGRSLMGCLDETRTLEYGQVFVQVSCIGCNQFNDLVTFNRKGSENRSFIVEGSVIVAKNPCLHPGDVRILRAVNIPALHHMMDCVVFPQKGPRPHPDECSGSDLDGDIYIVSWDPDLIPPRQMEPMDYSPARTAILEHDVELEEVQEYFANYMVNDSLGIIANAHTVFADREPGMAKSNACKELAKLFSIAVDFSKTGVPAEIPRHLHVKDYPDFMEKPDKPMYESTRVIGKLFRAVKDIAPDSIESFTWAVAKQCYDYEMEVDGYIEHIEDALYYKSKYDTKLGNLMNYYGVKTEAEIISRSIMTTTKSFDRRKDVEQIGLAVRSLKKEVKSWFDEKGFASGSQADSVYAKASAWYHVTYHPNYWGYCNEGTKNKDHFLSFPWCVYDKLLHIKRQNRAKANNGDGSLLHIKRRNRAKANNGDGSFERRFKSVLKLK